MTTWANTTCNAAGPGGSHCALPAGHAGDHRSETGALVAKGSKAKTSLARLAATPIALLIAGTLLGLLVGPLYLWFLGAAALSIVYVLVASQR
jgi:hypothetical protein